MSGMVNFTSPVNCLVGFFANTTGEDGFSGFQNTPQRDSLIEIQDMEVGHCDKIGFFLRGSSDSLAVTFDSNFDSIKLSFD